ncbi:RNA polymerase Rbp10 [Candidatus Bathyarchaeota archaeon]|nr:RNA polymerase Rbp10 [Candidatus Bathyarchaeota archaeon]NIR18055.1 RNA polymerase Rbp10 [Desulfobacterales bacterium]NIU81093.1 RNA polymerase Rbp10 [Candidatus Bathyarchaeota archaeon]NIV67729.1 RNA polymerase Rbp10 [Candidatus Bathyarchaeota archaeon]NIW34334.1 RNA polymerase Rbp10 [Candidatus Bathyarchaeota archaeon]
MILSLVSPISEEKTSGLVYKCIRCGAKVTTDEIKLRGGEVKCTICGYRVLKKIRPPIVKRVSTK